MSRIPKPTDVSEYRQRFHFSDTNQIKTFQESDEVHKLIEPMRRTQVKTFQESDKVHNLIEPIRKTRKKKTSSQQSKKISSRLQRSKEARNVINYKPDHGNKSYSYFNKDQRTRSVSHFAQFVTNLNSLSQDPLMLIPTSHHY